MIKINDPEVGALVARVFADRDREKREWIARLRVNGVKAAHPDDGWVDRPLFGAKTVHFANPQFCDGLEPGDLVAIGQPCDQDSRHRIVRLVEHVEHRGWVLPLGFWRYEPIQQPLGWLRVFGERFGRRIRDWMSQ